MIINMWVFYLMQVLENLAIVLILASLIMGCFLFVIGLYWTIECTGSYADKELGKKLLKWIKNLTIATVISLMVVVFIPTKDTMYKMLIASQVTHENVDIAQQKIEDIANYIVETVDKLND